MAANIEQQDFVLGDLQRQGDAVIRSRKAAIASTCESRLACDAISQL